MTPSRTTRVALACALAAAATSLGAALVSISVAGWNVTALVRMPEEQPLAELARASDPDFAFVHYHGRGDGASYYAIARDPFARGDEHRLIEWSAYRYGHPGYSWTARLVSFGRLELIPYAFLLLNVLAMGVAGAMASLISRELGHSPWGGLVVALSPGLIYATTIDTAEPVGAALLGVALLAWLTGRWKLALPALVALLFVKEWFVLVPLGLAVWELLQLRRVGRRAVAVRVAALGACILPFAFWYAYVVRLFGEWPAAPAGELLQLPLTGWARTMRLGADLGMQSFDKVVVGHVAVPVLAALGLALLVGAIRSLRLQNPIHPVFLAFMPVVLGLNSLNLLYTKDLMRTLAIPLCLLPAVVVDSRAWQAHRLREDSVTRAFQSEP